eukprot:364602-Chlamydomonas_euryale.AAC.5
MPAATNPASSIRRLVPHGGNAMLLHSAASVPTSHRCLSHEVTLATTEASRPRRCEFLQVAQLLAAREVGRGPRAQADVATATSTPAALRRPRCPVAADGGVEVENIMVRS